MLCLQYELRELGTYELEEYITFYFQIRKRRITEFAELCVTEVLKVLKLCFLQQKGIVNICRAAYVCISYRGRIVITI